VPVYYPPVLPGDPVVTYNTGSPGIPAVSAAFTFNMAVTVSSVSGRTITADGSSVTASPDDPSPGQARSLTLMPVGGLFSGLPDPREYTVLYADQYGAAGLDNETGETAWYYVEPSPWRDLFNAVYTPNEGAANAPPALPP
jgi:hypothetical protein